MIRFTALSRFLFLVHTVISVSNIPNTIEAQGASTTTAEDVIHDGPPYIFEFQVQLDVDTVDSFQIQVIPEWAPIGAARFLKLVSNVTNPPFFEGMRFFRVLDSSIAQFGINGDPAISSQWRTAYIEDDPVEESNRPGTISFAKTSTPNTRSTQFFVNLRYNLPYDSQGFAPFAYVTEGFDDVVMKLYSGYGDSQPRGDGPQQTTIFEEGNAYLESEFPLLSYIISVKRVPDVGEAPTDSPTAHTSGGISDKTINLWLHQKKSLLDGGLLIFSVCTFLF